MQYLFLFLSYINQPNPFVIFFQWLQSTSRLGQKKSEAKPGTSPEMEYNLFNIYWQNRNSTNYIRRKFILIQVLLTRLTRTHIHTCTHTRTAAILYPLHYKFREGIIKDAWSYVRFIDPYGWKIVRIITILCHKPKISCSLEFYWPLFTSISWIAATRQ